MMDIAVEKTAAAGIDQSIKDDIREIKSDVKNFLKAVGTLETRVSLCESGLGHGNNKFDECVSRLTKIEEGRVTAEMCRERHSGNRETIRTILSAASLVVAALAMVFVAVKAKGSTLGENNMDNIVTYVQANWQTWCIIAAGILAIVGIITGKIFPAIPAWVKTSAETKSAVNVLLCALAGVVMSFVPSANMVWYVGLLVGFAAGGGLLGGAAGYQATARSVRKRMLVRAIDKMNHGFVSLRILIGLVVSGLVIVLVGCAGPWTSQQSIWAQGGMSLASCLTKCGMESVVGNIEISSSNASVDTTGMGNDAISCLMSCTTSIGIPTLISSIAEATRDIKEPLCGKASCLQLKRTLVVTRTGE